MTPSRRHGSYELHAATLGTAAARAARPRILTRLATVAVVSFVAAACAPRLDASQARLCRGLAVALEAAEAAPSPPRPGARAGLVEVDVVADGMARTVTCAFRGGALSRERLELEGVRIRDAAGGEREIGPASLQLLRRAIEEDPAAITDLAPSPPAGRRAGALLGRVDAGTGQALQVVLAALPGAALTALLAAAYALVYGLVGRIVLAFGELGAIAGASTFVALAAAAMLGLDALAAYAVGAAGVVALTALQGRVLLGAVVAPLARRDPRATLIATLGLGIALAESLRLLTSGQTRWTPPVGSEPIALASAPGFDVTTTPTALLVLVAAALALAGLVIAMSRTRFGRAWRAVADDSLTASLCGVNERAVLRTSLTAAAALAGLAGVLATALYGAVGVSAGFALGLKALVAAVLGGIASVPGAALGGLAVGALEAAWTALLPLEMRDAALYAALVVALVVRSGGLVDRERGARSV